MPEPVLISVLFLVAFSVLTSVTAHHLPLYQSITIAFQILVLSISFIVPSVVQCYFADWLTILPITQPMMRLQHGVMFHLIHCGIQKPKFNCPVFVGT